jgi:AcrR family transcriptional regulator
LISEVSAMTDQAAPLSPRDAIIRALVDLLAEKPIERVTLAEVATRAGVSLADLRDEFGSLLGILAARTKDLDRKVLAGGEPDIEAEPTRDRLFDVLMRRLEAMREDRAAVGSLMRSASCNPGLAAALNAMAVRSQSFMLAAAGLSSAGPKAMIEAQGLALLFAKVLRTFVRDEDPGLARTMAALDRELARGQRLAGLLNCLCRLAPRRRHRARRHMDDGDGLEERFV